VMPTYFGPTNIPPLEALALGVPVCYSDLPAFREQLGARAAYFDLCDPRSLADILSGLMERAVSAPQAVSTAQAPEQVDRYVAILLEVLNGYARKVLMVDLLPSGQDAMPAREPSTRQTSPVE